jgi:hypothetical protein
MFGDEIIDPDLIRLVIDVYEENLNSIFEELGISDYDLLAALVKEGYIGNSELKNLLTK